MRCTSDYDNAEQAMLRQMDECVEEWWEGDPPTKAVQADGATREVDRRDLAEQEALRRGLIRYDPEGETCMSCPQETKTDEVP